MSTTHQIYAVYAGNTYFVGATTNHVNLTVNPVNSRATTTSLVAVRSPQGANMVVTVTSNSAAAGIPKGTVTYFFNGHQGATQTLANGRTSRFITSANLIGKTFVVKYSGDATHSPSSSPPIVYGQAAFRAASRPLTAFAHRGHASSLSNGRTR